MKNTPTPTTSLNKRPNSAAVVATLPHGKCIVSQQPITTTAAQLGRLFIESNHMQTLYVRILNPIQSNHHGLAQVVRVGAYGLVLKLSDGTISKYWAAGLVEVAK